jgi:hypothetical protein
MTRDLTLKLTGINPCNVFLAYPGVSDPFVQARPDEAEIRSFRDAETGGAPYLLHVGGCENYKNFRTILKAFCRIATKSERHLLIVGRAQYISLAKRLSFQVADYDITIATNSKQAKVTVSGIDRLDYTSIDHTKVCR